MLRLLGVRFNPVLGLVRGLAAIGLGLATDRTGVALAGGVMLLVASAGGLGRRRQPPHDRERR